MALLGKGKSILSCLQMEAYGADINDRPQSLADGKQRILFDGYNIQLVIKNGPAYLCCSKLTADDIDLLPHIIMTADVEWDPNIFDNEFESLDDFYDPKLDDFDHVNPFNAYGEYCNRTISTHHLVEEEEEFDTIEYNDFEAL
jgi:hypothetical protein